MATSTCILYFTRTPREESKYKQLATSRSRNCRTIYHLYQCTKACISHSQLPAVELTQRQQRGKTFGERLTNGLLDLFAQGFSNVIVVGNDCPRLTVQDLRDACDALEQGKQVMGHNQNGGAYLIGVSQEHFCNERFRALPWNSSSLGQELETYFLDQGDCRILDLKADINDEFDLSKLLKHYPSFFLVKILINLLAERQRWNTQPVSHYLGWIPSVRLFRGPPSSMVA